MSSPSLVLSSVGRAYSFGKTPFKRWLSRSMASIALSTRTPISGLLAAAWSGSQRASFGTQKAPALTHSSGSSGSASGSAARAACLASKASEMCFQEHEPEDDVLVLVCLALLMFGVCMGGGRALPTGLPAIVHDAMEVFAQPFKSALAF